MDVRQFALGAGIVYLVIGVLGLIPGVLVAPPMDAPPVRVDSLYGYLLGLFPVNILHTLFHLVIGVWGLSVAKNLVQAIWYARSVAIIYGILTIFGLIPYLNTFFGLIPLHGHDIWLHAFTTLAAAYFGFFVPNDKTLIRPSSSRAQDTSATHK